MKNIPASVHQRLLNQARNDRRPFNELLQYYAMERFLYRLSRSDHADKFILKGALMLRAWDTPATRPTMDIDMLAKTSNEQHSILQLIKEIILNEVEPDGIVFSADSLTAETITEDADYEGMRIRFVGNLEKARIHMQIDIGFGDVIFPEPELIILPCLLGAPCPKLRSYSRESTIAEKYEIMVKLGELNSRMKDFYDIWLLSRQYEFNFRHTSEAIRLTFSQRRTKLPEQAGFSKTSFAEQKQVQWNAFRNRIAIDHIPKSFHKILEDLEMFLNPVTSYLSGKNGSMNEWKPPGPWK